MKTLKDTEHTKNNDWGVPTQMYYKQDVKETLQNFYDDYWKQSHQGDKFKHYIDCDRLDFLVDKHFGHIIDIETMQYLLNQDLNIEDKEE